MRVASHLLTGLGGLGDDCVVGALDANGNTIAYCPPPLPPGSEATFTCPSGLIVPMDVNGGYSCPPGPSISPAQPGPTLPGLPLTGTPQLTIQPVLAGQVYGAPGSSGVPVLQSSMSTWLIYGGVAIAALVLISSVGGRRR